MKSFAQYLTESLKHVELADFAPILSHTSPESLKLMDRKLNQYISLANAAIDAGGVLKSGYKDLSGSANAIAETAFDQLLAKYRYAGRYESLPKDLQYYEFKPNHIGLVTSSLAKAEKLKVDHPYKTDAITILKNLLQVEALVGYFKEHIVVKLSKSEREDKAAYEAPKSTKDAKLLVATVLTKVTNEVKAQYIIDLETPWIEELEKFFTKEHQDQLRHLKLHPEDAAALKAKNAADQKVHYERHGNTWGFRAEQRPHTFLETTLLPVAATITQWGAYSGDPAYWTDRNDPMYGKPLWTPKPNWKHLLHLKAEEDAEEMQRQFVDKNIRKLTSIVETKGNIEGEPKVISAFCRRGVIESNIKFTFQDGSYFTVRNKVVAKFYEPRSGGYATMYQFPTTFHDARLPNGTFMSGQPSEEQMNKIFSIATKG